MRAFEGVDGSAGESKRVAFCAGVNHERTAARLTFGSDNFAAFGGKDADRGGVDLREEFALHAAEEEADADALFALCRSDFRNGFGGAEWRHERFEGAEFLGDEMEKAGFANEGLEAGFLVREQGPAKKAKAVGARKKREDHRPMEFF